MILNQIISPYINNESYKNSFLITFKSKASKNEKYIFDYFITIGSS
jgi:hypothetical protein